MNLAKPALCAAFLGTLVLFVGFHIGPLRAQQDESYPREVRLPSGSVSIHHPTVSDWRDFAVLSAWVPVEITPDDGVPWAGSVMVQAVTDIRFEERLVLLTDLRPVRAQADESLPEGAQSLKDNPDAYPLLKDALKQARQSISLEYLLRALPEDFADTLIAPPRGREQDPPEIMLSEKPAILILFDGPPQTAAIKNSQLEIVVNTDWLMFHHTPGDFWYLVFGDYWLQNNSLSGGSWQVAAELPADIENLAMASGWERLARKLPPKQTDRVPPPLKLSYEPAELILFDGPPQLQALQGTELQFVANADHDLFLYQGRYYLLLAGRWFSARDLKSKWSFVSELPAEFARIPINTDQAHVLASVPGTENFRIAQIEAALQRSQSEARESGPVAEEQSRNPGRQAYKHTYGYSGTYTADKGLQKGTGPTGSGTYYDPTYDPRQRDPAFWGAYAYGGYWPPYGYGARYNPARGAWAYGGYHDPYWGSPYPYPRPVSVTVDIPDSNTEWVRGEDGQQRPADSGSVRNYIGSGTYQLDGQPGTVDDPTAAGHIYSGPDGRLYRNTGQGWQIQQGKKWVLLSEPLPDPVNREYQARLAGYASYQRYLQEQANRPEAQP